MVNRAVLVGRLTRDVELKKTGNGTSIANFTVACDRMKKKGDEGTADFISCVAWRQPAEFLSNYGKKGDMIAVDGRLQTSNYDQNGRTVYRTEVIAEQVRLLGGKAKDTGRQEQSNSEPDYDFDSFNPDDLNF